MFEHRLNSGIALLCEIHSICSIRPIEARRGQSLSEGSLPIANPRNRTTGASLAIVAYAGSNTFPKVPQTAVICEPGVKYSNLYK